MKRALGLLHIFKRPKKSESETEKSATPIDLKSQLDTIEKEVFSKLKPLGFQRKGRTLNRRLDSGLIQVINFQSGQYPIGQGYEIPGLRENLYGKFTVNLGVCIESLYKLEFPTKSKKYYKEHECQIRNRLGLLLTGQDSWWEITIDNNIIAQEIIEGVETKAFDWFSGVDTKEKIILNNGQFPYDTTPRAKLDTALMVWLDDKAKGSELFKEYYKSIRTTESPHKKYVIDLANELNIDL